MGSNASAPTRVYQVRQHAYIMQAREEINNEALLRVAHDVEHVERYQRGYRVFAPPATPTEG